MERKAITSFPQGGSPFSSEPYTSPGAPSEEYYSRKVFGAGFADKDTISLKAAHKKLAGTPEMLCTMLEFSCLQNLIKPSEFFTLKTEFYNYIYSYKKPC
ncbi:MAG: hypothetical protein IJP54_02340 [Synergistaceae bacterium]|nr:hypothetical protein [Synergistaceae bacterium]